MGPYINDGHYMYGKNECCFPRPPFYECITHLQPCIRDFHHCCRPDGDGTPFKPDDSDSSGEINRDSLQFNLVNIETKLIRNLDITLYGTSKDLDKHIVLEPGKRYSITYMTECGFKTANGVLKEISNNVPDECIRYIGDYRTPAINAYIGMDCSTEGSSDKRLIYINSIRDIKELADGETPPSYDSMSDSEKLEAIYEAIKEGKLVINCDKCNCNKDTSTDESTKDNTDSSGTGEDSKDTTETNPDHNETELSQTE